MHFHFPGGAFSSLLNGFAIPNPKVLGSGTATVDSRLAVPMSVVLHASCSSLVDTS